MNYVDSAQINAIEWFYGGGGNHLGLGRVIPGLRIRAACEIEAYAVANLVAKAEGGWTHAFPCWTDCKTFPFWIFRGLIDLFIASYPCQGYSHAGQRKGADDPRFLWPFVLRAIIGMRPRRVFLENVEGHITLGLSTVLSDLEAAGYRCTWGIFSAEECGASQRRKRVFILGERVEVADSECFPRRTQWRTEPGQRSDAGPQQVAVPRNAGKTMADAMHHGCNGDRDCNEGGRDEFADGGGTVDDPKFNRCEGRGQKGRRPVAALPPDQAVASSSGGRLQIPEQPALFRKVGRKKGGKSSEFRLPPFPPGPEDLDAWRAVLAIDPSLEPALCRMADGMAHRVDRLRLTGNGVVPDTAALAWLTLDRKLAELK